MRILFTALAATLFAGAALAETDVDLTVLRPVVETAIVDGVEVETIDYEPVTSAVPGETLTYRISLSNDSTASADDIRMVLPVDDSLTFVPGSLRTDTGALLSVSVDSGATFGDLEALEISRDGEAVPATAADVTSLAITVPTLSGEGETHIEYDVTVN